MLRAFLLVLALAWLPNASSAQDEAFDELELRVTNSRPGIAVVDRGASDGLAEHDRVVFEPRGGSTKQGHVTRVEERNAVVELVERSVELPPGTRGTVRVPHSRLAPTVAPTASPETTPPAETAAPEHPRQRWRNRDENWQRGDPLLAKVTPLRPEQRPPTVDGRLYASLEAIRSTEDDRRNGYVRAGADIEYDNLFGGGETLHIDGELNYRQTGVPDDEDEVARRGRLDRLSYAVGGTRFRPTRFEAGRFLQNGMPEFGVLDGLEWNRRTSSGDRFGASLGYMPEPDRDYQTGEDLQFAGFYRWVSDASEQLALAGGYQKSFHHSTADRDLFVLDVDYLPDQGWRLFATAWVDLYTGSDTAKGAGLEPTQVIADASRSFDGGSSLDLIYTHLAFPEIERNEFTPVTFAQLADDHAERLALRGRAPVAQRSRVFGELGAWIDEDEYGGDGELGVEFDDVLFQQSVADAAVFGVSGRFTQSVGARASFDTYSPGGGLRLDYEIANHRVDGFSNGNDDLLQHRVRATFDVQRAEWSLSGYFEVGLWDSENSLTGGFYLQRSF